MESLENSVGQSTNDSFSLYERYMRSFSIVGSDRDHKENQGPIEPVFPNNFDSDSSNSRGNIDLCTAAQNNDLITHRVESDCNLLNHNTCDNILATLSDSEFMKTEADYQSSSPAAESLYTSSTTTEKSNHTDLHVSSEESKRGSFKPPLFLTSTMENSNNAVDSVPMFRDIRHAETVFKLPNIELSFNGTLKHVQKLTPIVDPVSVLSSQNLGKLDEQSGDQFDHTLSNNESNAGSGTDQKDSESEIALEKTSESTGDSQYEESNLKNEFQVNEDDSSTKWNLEHSLSSFETSFDSGVRSPNMFSDDEADDEIESERDVGDESEPFWKFLKDHEAYDKKRVRKIEDNLQGILPPPSVTIIKTDVTEMLKKYYTFLPLFNETAKLKFSEEANSTTPTKRVSFIEIPEIKLENEGETSKSFLNTSSKNNLDLDTSAGDKTIELKMCTELEAVETAWPKTLKCRHHDVYYNVTKFSEKFELLALKYGERYVGGETDSSVNIHSGGFQSPSSANKRKALRLKLAQAKSPGRRLSHLARRRQAFCSAATINEKAQASTARMVLIDKNYFPHRKLVNSCDRKSPRTRRTPGKKTPSRKTPGKKTPAKTPKTGGSSKKKAMRRLLMDSETMTRSQPREALKRALFISPEHRKSIPTAPSTSVPINAMKPKRALDFSTTAETKSMDGTRSDHFLKRRRDTLDDVPETSKSKIAKSLSFGGGAIGNSQPISFSRRASEVFTGKKSAELNDNHRQKLLWAVSEALRIHGWRMSSPGFREKASSLARLTRRLLTLPPYSARLAATNLSTSDTFLKLARMYVFAIIQGRTVEECFEEEQTKLANADNSKVSGYISANAYQQMKSRQSSSSSFNPIKENSCSNFTLKQEPKSGTKNVLQDKLVNIDPNSNSSSGMSLIDRANLGLFKSNSMPSFEEAAKMRARRQISFDNVDFPKR